MYILESCIECIPVYDLIFFQCYIQHFKAIFMFSLDKIILLVIVTVREKIDDLTNLLFTPKT